jgi:hypothetical protein
MDDYPHAAIAFSGVVSAIIFGKQLIAMQGQLTEMRTTRESGDKATASQLGLMRDQTKAMQRQLAAMQSASAQTERAIAATNRLAEDHLTFGPRQVGAGGECIFMAGVDELKSGNTKPLHRYGFGRAEYLDIYDRNSVHLTEFCFASSDIVVPLERGAKLVRSDLTFCPTHNCSDNDCSQDAREQAKHDLLPTPAAARRRSNRKK